MIDAQDAKYTPLIVRTDASTAVASARLDTKDADYASVLISLDQLPDTTRTGPTISVLHSDTTGTASFGTFDSALEQTISNTNANGFLYVGHIDMKARKRYLQIKVTPGTAGTNEEVAIHAVGQLTRLKIGPESTAEMVSTGSAAVV